MDTYQEPAGRRYRSSSCTRTPPQGKKPITARTLDEEEKILSRRERRARDRENEREGVEGFIAATLQPVDPFGPCEENILGFTRGDQSTSYPVYFIGDASRVYPRSFRGFSRAALVFFRLASAIYEVRWDRRVLHDWASEGKGGEKADGKKASEESSSLVKSGVAKRVGLRLLKMFYLFFFIILYLYDLSCIMVVISQDTL